MAFRSGTDGQYSTPDSAHLYIKASGETTSLGELAGGSSSSFANVGLIDVINATDETETISRTAENSKTDIKVIAGNRKKSYTVDAVVGNDVNLSLANGVITVYDSTLTDVDISDSPASIYGEVIIMFMTDGQWNDDGTVSERGEYMKNCLIKCMGKSPSYTGKSKMVYRFEIIPFADSNKKLYRDVYARTFDATADYLGLSDFSPAISA